MTKTLHPLKKQIDELILKRIKQLKDNKNQDNINILEPAKKRHPARKQLNGRIEELKYIQEEIRAITIKNQ